MFYLFEKDFLHLVVYQSFDLSLQSDVFVVPTVVDLKVLEKCFERRVEEY